MNDQSVTSPAESLIFISYSRKDQAFVRSLNDALLAHKRTTWVDLKDIPFTGVWEQEIYSAIEKSDVCVFVITPDSIKSEVCAKELAHAVAHNKKLVPIVRRDCDPVAAPPALATLNWLFFRESDDFKKSFTDLLKVFDTDLDWVKAHTRLLVRAKEWSLDRRDTSSLLRGSDLKEGESWLFEATGKEPPPTTLHTEYLTASRKAATRRQRVLISGVAAGLAVAVVLGVVAWNRAKIAEEQTKVAAKNRTEAVAQGLVNKAQLIKKQEGNLLELAVLLTIESMKRFPTLQADQFLRENLPLLTPRVANLSHQDVVSSVLISGDGKYLITGSRDDLVQVWELQTGRKVSNIKHRPQLTAIAFSGDGKYVGTGNEGGVVQVWELMTGREITGLKHRGRIRGIAFSPDGHYFASGSTEDQLVISATTDGHEVARLAPEGGAVAVAFSPDGKLIAASSGWGMINVWDTANQTQLTSMQPQIADVMLTQLKFSPDSKYVVSGGFSSIDGVVVPGQVWDATSGQLTATLKGKANIDKIIFTQDGKYLATAGGNEAIVWLATSGRKILNVIHQSGINDLAFSSNGNYLITGSADNSAAVWEVPSGKELIRLRHGAAVGAVAFSPQGNYVATGSDDKTAAIWALPTSQKSIQFGDKLYINRVTFSPDTKYVATGAIESEDQDMARIWDAASGRPLVNVSHDHQVYSRSFYGDYLATGSGDRTARIWQLPEGREVRRLPHQFEVRSVAFSPNGKYLATGTSGGGKSVHIWDVSTGSEAKRLEHNSAIGEIAFSGDSRRLVSSSFDNTTRVWTTDNGQEIMRLTRTASAVALNGDGSLLASGGFDVTVWEVPSGRAIPVVKDLDEQKQVETLLFSPDGKYLATSDGKTVRVWEVSSSGAREIARIQTSDWVRALKFSSEGEYLSIAAGALTVRSEHWQAKDMIADACARVSRNLNPDEWKTYFGEEQYAETCPRLTTQ